MKHRVTFLVVLGVILVPFAVAVQAWDQTSQFAEVQQPAIRDPQPIQVTDTEAPPPRPSIRSIVNGLHYQHYLPGPALTAFRLVASERGWSSAKTLAWEPFVNDVLFGESAYCWNRRNGDTIEAYSACHILHTTTREDVGFGQVTRSYYGQGAQLCELFGICSAGQILASPYDSMKWSIVVPIELDGSQPWCYNDYARRYHKCGLAPDR